MIRRYRPDDVCPSATLAAVQELGILGKGSEDLCSSVRSVLKEFGDETEKNGQKDEAFRLARQLHDQAG